MTRFESEQALRDAMAAFLHEHTPGPPPGGREDRVAWQRRWAATLYDGGFAGPAWPAEYGGMDLPFPLQVAYHEVLASRRTPPHPGSGPSICGPTLISHGTDEQRSRWLPRMLRGDDVWAQGFSEPEAGSDLPSLRTTARRDGDTYVVSGQKIWSSHCDIADMLFALVRTGTRESRAKGISYLLIDLRSPGVTVRPITDLAGETQFGEIFLDEVRVPVANRVGEENAGWEIARTTLGHERAARSLTQAAAYRRRFAALVRLAKENGRLDPILRDRLAQLAIRVRIQWFTAVRTISELTATGTLGANASVSRLYHATLEQDLFDLAVDVCGPAGLFMRGDPYAIERGDWAKGLLRTRGSTIGAGTAEIQRNTIAERVLGLPPDPTTAVPWQSPARPPDVAARN